MADLIPVMQLSELAMGRMRACTLATREIVICHTRAGVFALDNTCTHAEASLSEDGCVVGEKVECGWHFGQFEIRTGHACLSPCTKALRTWPLQVVDGRVCVEVPDA